MLFWVRGSNTVLSTKKFGSAGVLGPPMTSLKPLKLQYLLNGAYYEGD